MKTLLLPLVLVLHIGACGKDNPYYCENAPGHNCGNNPSTDGGTTACVRDDQCPSATPVCETGQGVCVACTAAEIGACGGATPVCSNNLCIACASHGQCGSNVCLTSGACAMPTDVAYVSATGIGTACTMASPCGLEDAIATAMPYVRVLGTGTVSQTGSIPIARAVTIFGEGAKIDRNGDGVILVVSAGADAAIYDLEIGGATNPNGDAIELTGGTLALHRVRIAMNQGLGIEATGGTIVMSRSTVTRCDEGGLSTTSTTSNVQFQITNNFFYRNGNESTAFVGGVALFPPSSGTRVFEFNTVVDNEVRSGSTISGGVRCDLDTVIAPNNLVARNSVNNNPAATNANWMGDCPRPTSIVTADISTLNFISPDNDTPFNYRLAAGSTAIDQATTTSATTIDVDGDTRPQGGAKDIGADEYK